MMMHDENDDDGEDDDDLKVQAWETDKQECRPPGKQCTIPGTNVSDLILGAVLLPARK